MHSNANHRAISSIRTIAASDSEMNGCSPVAWPIRWLGIREDGWILISLLQMVQQQLIRGWTMVNREWNCCYRVSPLFCQGWTLVLYSFVIWVFVLGCGKWNLTLGLCSYQCDKRLSTQRRKIFKNLCITKTCIPGAHTRRFYKLRLIYKLKIFYE